MRLPLVNATDKIVLEDYKPVQRSRAQLTTREGACVCPAECRQQITVLFELEYNR
jgi:hypothetical protein